MANALLGTFQANPEQLERFALQRGRSSDEVEGLGITDRQRIKRKAQSWGRRYAALPLAERLAVLGAMMAVEAER